MSYTCPKDPAHQSVDSDYCSVCGARIAGPSGALSGGPAEAARLEACPDCGAERHESARFCEICRYNFETRVSGTGGTGSSTPAGTNGTPRLGTSPPAGSSAPAGTNSAGSTDAPVMPAVPGRWEVVVNVDPSLDTDPDPATPCPTEEPERVFPLDFAENLIGRRSDRKDIHPEIPVNDPGVSHRHAKLLRQPDGSFLLLDVGSTNGTQLNGVDVLPGVRTPLTEGDQIVVGCWTRILLRRI